MQTKFSIPTGYNWHVAMVRICDGVMECSLFGSYTTQAEAEKAAQQAAQKRTGWNFLAFRQAEN